MTTATGSFEVTSGSDDALDALPDEIRVSHATGRQRFSGDIEGDGAIDWLMLYRPDGSARFVGLQRIVGSIGGRSGSVVIEAVGDHDGSSSRADWTIVEGSGSGALTGIRGTGTFVAPGGPSGTYVLDYQLPDVG